MNDVMIHDPASPAPVRRRRNPGSCRAVTPARREAFLEALREYPSIRIAAARGSPHAVGDHHGESTWRDLVARDPVFGQKVQVAMAQGVARLERIAIDLATGKIEKPIYRAHGLVGSERIYDVVCLLRALGRADPSWRESRHTEHSGTVHSTSLSMSLVLEPGDLLLLDEPKRSQLAELLLEVGRRRAAKTEDAAR